MARFRSYLATLALVAAPLPAFSGEQADDLEPASSSLGAYAFEAEYHSSIRATLLKGATDQPSLRMLCLPSFEAEWAVTVGTPENGDARVEYRIALAKIWGHEEPEKIKITVREATIARTSAEVLYSAWKKMLLRTRYPPPSNSIGLDGTTYYFTSFHRNVGMLEGTTWSPTKSSRTRQLVAIAEAL